MGGQARDIPLLPSDGHQGRDARRRRALRRARPPGRKIVKSARPSRRARSTPSTSFPTSIAGSTASRRASGWLPTSRGGLAVTTPTTRAIPVPTRVQGHAAVRRPLEGRHRADADRPVVRATPRSSPSRASAVENGDTVFVPKNWEKTYFEWMRQHRAVVHLAPALVGASDPGLVRPRWRNLR
jgi:hypothetical protein